MSKPVLGLVLGAILGIMDGLTALFYLETAPLIMGILIGSCVKGMLAGVLLGFLARKVKNIPVGTIVGLLVGFGLAYLVAMQPDEQGRFYYLEIMIPGSIVGLFLGYVTQKYGRVPAGQPAR